MTGIRGTDVPILSHALDGVGQSRPQAFWFSPGKACLCLIQAG